MDVGTFHSGHVPHTRHYVVIALGEIGDKRAVEPLIKVLEDKGWVRARMALGEKQTRGLQRELLDKSHEEFRHNAKETLMKILKKHYYANKDFTTDVMKRIGHEVE